MFYSKANREIKNSAFIDYFEEPQRFLSLYNAVSGLNLPLDTFVEFKTLDNVLFYGKKNDIAALLDDRIIFLIEHQSTVNENMAVRLFIYLGRVYEKIIDKRKLYEGRLFKIPRPEFIVLYNGATRNDYNTAVVMAVKHCIKENIMVDYLEEHSSEVINMLTEEFDMDYALEVRYEEGIVQGIEKGMEQGIVQGIVQGMEQGLEKGIVQGMEQGAVQVAANMLKDGLDPALISKYSGLDINTITRLGQ